MRKTSELMVNTFIILLSTIIMWTMIELAFNLFINNLPVRLHYLFPEAMQPMAQTSKSNKIPENYIAIVGDSYAAGKGDWYDNINKMTRSPFHSADIIHKITNRDVISFGHSGAGSVRGMVEAPIGKFEYIRSVYSTLQAPDDILVYFYEGNDLNDNRRDISFRFHHNSLEKLFEPIEFEKFIETIALGEDSLIKGAERGIFNRLNLTFQAKDKLNKRRNKMHDWQRDPGIPAKNSFLTREITASPLLQSRGYNHVIINNEVIRIDTDLQSPALELDEHEIDISLYIFEQSYLKLARYFPESRIHFIYIPSPSTSYKLHDTKVSIRTYENRHAIYPSNMISERSNIICSKVDSIAHKYNVLLFDPRPAILELTNSVALHGPNDWQHFNEAGYRLLGKEVSAFLQQQRQSGCADIPAIRN